MRSEQLEKKLADVRQKFFRMSSGKGATKLGPVGGFPNLPEAKPNFSQEHFQPAGGPNLGA
jgi:hypothetical protein